MVNKKETIKPTLQEAVDVNSEIFKAFVIPSNPIWVVNLNHYHNASTINLSIYLKQKHGPAELRSDIALK
jgi:hypothetical protein